MRRAPSALLLTLVGTLGPACFRGDSGGLPCGPSLACPVGQACVAGVCQAGAADADVPARDGPAGADADPSDDDGDGVANDDDNCPRIGNDQHDEDLDGLGDPCDGCPWVGGMNGTGDPDGDGVTGECDPGPANHRLGLFVPFTGPTLEVAPAPGLTFTGGDLHADARTAFRWITIAAPTADDTITLGFDIRAVEPSVNRQLYVEVARVGADGVYCEMFALAGSTQGKLALVSRTGGPPVDHINSALEFRTGSYQLSFAASSRDREGACVLRHNGSSSAISATIPTVRPGPEVYLGLNGLEVDLHYLALVRTP